MVKSKRIITIDMLEHDFDLVGEDEGLALVDAFLSLEPGQRLPHHRGQPRGAS